MLCQTITFNSYFSREDTLTKLNDIADWFLFGEEICPNTGRVHFQGMAYSKKQIRWLAKLKPIHIEVCKDPIKSIEYCSKDGKVTEKGVRPSFNIKRAKAQNLKRLMNMSQQIQPVNIEKLPIYCQEKRFSFKRHLECFNKDHKINTRQLKVDLICIQPECMTGILLCVQCQTDKTCKNYVHSTHEKEIFEKFIDNIAKSSQFSLENQTYKGDLMNKTNSKGLVNNGENSSDMSRQMKHFRDSMNGTTTKIEEIFQNNLEEITNQIENTRKVINRSATLKCKYFFDIIDETKDYEEVEAGIGKLKGILNEEENIIKNLADFTNFANGSFGILEKFRTEICLFIDSKFFALKECLFKKKDKGNINRTQEHKHPPVQESDTANSVGNYSNMLFKLPITKLDSPKIQNDMISRMNKNDQDTNKVTKNQRKPEVLGIPVRSQLKDQSFKKEYEMILNYQRKPELETTPTLFEQSAQLFKKNISIIKEGKYFNIFIK